MFGMLNLMFVKVLELLVVLKRVICCCLWKRKLFIVVCICVVLGVERCSLCICDCEVLYYYDVF